MRYDLVLKPPRNVVFRKTVRMSVEKQKQRMCQVKKCKHFLQVHNFTNA